MPIGRQQGEEAIGIISIYGRNGSDSKLTIPDRQCLEAYNIDWFQSSLGAKRGGASAIGLTGGTAFSTGAVAGARHVPSDDQTLAEFWAIDGARAFHRLAGGTAWADPTVLDACSATPQETVFLPFNGKLYAAYKNAHNRLHVWDGTSLRRTGLDLPAVVTSLVEAGGSIVSDTRTYRISWCKRTGSVTTQRSNLSVASAQVVFTNEQVTVTRTTAPNEGETHWELWAASTSSGFGDYRLIATTAIATTTAVDNLNTLPSGLLNTAPADGANTPPPSCKYMVADDSRVIMAGAYETSANAENAMVPKTNRIWWTSNLGASDVSDDERVSNTGTINSYDDIEEAPTGLSQPLQVISAQASSLERGSFYVFSYQSQWKFVSTGTSTSPYLSFRISGGIGAIHHKSICTAIDSNGNPAIYWASTLGPMRIGVDGQQFLGEDLIDLWATINLDATIPCHTVFYPKKHQVWMYIATGTNMYPNIKLMFDTKLGKLIEDGGVRQGWALHEGESTKAYFSCLFSTSIGASMGRNLVPHIGYSGGTAIWQCDVFSTATGTTTVQDAGTSYQAYIDSKSYAPWGLGRKGGMPREAYVVADPAPGVQLQLTIFRNEGAESLPFLADLTPHSDSAEEESVFAKFKGSDLSDSFTFRCRVGDQQATDAYWSMDAIVAPVTYEGE